LKSVLSLGKSHKALQFGYRITVGSGFETRVDRAWVQRAWVFIDKFKL
jgi:hypothetical protein